MRRRVPPLATRRFLKVIMVTDLGKFTSSFRETFS